MMEGIEGWKDIEGYEGDYQVSLTGKVRRIYKSGKVRQLRPYIKQNAREILVVGLNKNGVKKEVAVHSIVAKAFLGEPEAGKVIHHTNGLIRDNWASNLAYIDRKELGRMTGARSRRQGVVKIDWTGEMVEFYSSARQAGKENYMSYQTIIDRCNGKVKSAFAPDGHAYAWEDCEISIKRAMYKINNSKEGLS